MKQIGILKVSTGQTAKIFHDVEYSEFRVKFYDDEGMHMPDADYHTDDEEDARGTARAELERIEGAGLKGVIMYLHIFMGNPKRNTPVCIETNIEHALKYWKKRKESNENITWVLSSQPKLDRQYIG